MAIAMPRQDTASCEFSELARALADIVVNGNNAERCLAVQGLGKLDHPTATDTLIASLRDADPDVRCDAAAALAGLNVSAACQPLTDNLREDPDSEAKTQYVKALQTLGADGCLDLLSALAVGRGEHHDIAWDEAYSDWDDWLDVQLAAVEALGVLGAEQAPAVIETALNDPEGQDLWPVACTALARLGRPGMEKLQQLLPQASVLNRKRVAAALAATDPALSGALMRQLAADRDASVRLAVVESAAASASDEILTLGLDDVAPEVRAAAVAGLGQVSTKVLDKALNDISPIVVIAACKAIEGAGQPVAGLALVSRTERSLRTKPPELIAAMLAAAAVAEPRQASALIEDICDHRNTDARVRRVCLRAASTLNMPGLNEMLDQAIASDDQAVRMEAISALADLAEADGPDADRAAVQLAETIAGAKIAAPAGEGDQETGTVVQFVPKKGKQAAGDEGDATIKLDRGGNEMPSADKSDRDGTDEAAQSGQNVDEPPPQSTLQAIMAVNPERMQAGNTVELEDADLSFLEMTGSLVRRRKLDPEAKPPAHLDVRRLAASVAGDTRKSVLVTALARAATERDAALSDAALSSLRRLADQGIDMSEAEQDMIVLASGNDDGRCRQAIPVLVAIASPESVEAVRNTAGHRSPQMRAASLAALVTAGTLTDEEFASAVSDPDHKVRLAAIEARQQTGHPGMVALLLEQARMESGRHKHEVAKLLATRPSDALPTLTDWIAGADTQSRYLALEMLPVVLAAMAGNKEGHDHAAAS